MSDPSHRPVGIRSIQERIRAMNETLDTVEQRQKLDVTMRDPIRESPNAGTRIVELEAPSTLPSVGKRSSVVDLWRMRESRSGDEAGVVVSGSKKKATAIMSAETFRSLNTLLSKQSPEQSEEKKEDQDCVPDDVATSTSLSQKKSPSRIVASTSSPPKKPPPLSDMTILPSTSSVSTSSGNPEKRSSKIASILEKLNQSNDSSSGKPLGTITAKEMPHQPADEERGFHNDIAKDCMLVEVKAGSPNRHSVVDIWKNRTTSQSNDTIVAKPIKSSAKFPQRQHFDPSTGLDPIHAVQLNAYVSDADSIPTRKQDRDLEEIKRNDVDQEFAPGQRELLHAHSFNRNDDVVPSLPTAEPNLKLQSEVSSSVRDLKDRWSNMNLTACKSPSKSDIAAYSTAFDTKPSPKSASKDTGKTQTVNAVDEIEKSTVLLSRNNSEDPQTSIDKTSTLQSDPCDKAQSGICRNIMDRYKFHATTGSSSSDVKTVSPIVTSIVKEHASRTHVGIYKNNKGRRDHELHSNSLGIVKSTETDSPLFTARTAIESSVTSVVDKHVVQRGKVSDRWTSNNTPSPYSEKVSTDTSDLPKTRGKVTDRWKPQSASVIEVGCKFDRATVAELLKLHSANTPFAKGRNVKYSNDEPKSLKSSTANVECKKDSPVELSPPPQTDGLTSLSSVEHDPIEPSPQPRTKVADRSTSSLNPTQEQKSSLKEASSYDITGNDLGDTSHYSAYSANVEDASTPSYINHGTNRACTNPETRIISKSSASSSKVDVADRWKKRLDQAKEFNIENETNVEGLPDVQMSPEPGDSGRAAREVENSVNDDAAKPRSFVDNQEISFSSTTNKVDVVQGQLVSPVKPSLSVIDYAAKLKRVPGHPSYIPEDKKELDFGSPLRIIQAGIVKNTLSSDASQKGEIEKTPSSQEKKDFVVKSTNASAFAPWQNIGEMSTVGNSFKTISASEERKHIVSYSLRRSEALKDESGHITSYASSNLVTVVNEDSNIYECDRITKISVSDQSSRQPISLSTKKLASDRALNKKRLQQYRGKAKKATITKKSTSEDSSHSTPMKKSFDDVSREFVSSQSISHDDNNYNAVGTASGPLSQATPMKKSFEDLSRKVVSHQSISYDENNYNAVGTDSGPFSQATLEKNSFDFDGPLRSTGSETELLSQQEIDDEAFAAICSTSSTTSASPLASKAEKMLQERRRRSTVQCQKSVNETVISERPPSHLFNGRHIDDPDGIVTAGAADFPEDFTDDKTPRLFTRYNTSSRFADTEASESVPAVLPYGYESIDSSFNETETTDSHGGYYGVDRQLANEKKVTSKRRKAPIKDPPGQMSDDKSVNLSSHSAWDSDWSLDFNKIVSAVDEQVTALRDFVGVGNKKVSQQSKKKNYPRTPQRAKAPLEMEDVAIEVEYVEDSFDDDDPRVDLGFCTAPIDDVVRGSLNCSQETKASISRRFVEPCTGMLPTGEPSYEQKPIARTQSHRNGYV